MEGIAFLGLATLGYMMICGDDSHHTSNSCSYGTDKHISGSATSIYDVKNYLSIQSKNTIILLNRDHTKSQDPESNLMNQANFPKKIFFNKI